MVKKRRRHTAAYKFRITLEALEASKTISQLSSEHMIQPKIPTTPQAAHPIAASFTACLPPPNIQVSIDSRALDSVFCERLSRSVKNKNIYLNQYDTVRQLQTDLTA